MGPGRLERGYLERLGALERSLEQAAERGSGLERQLELSQRLERGCQTIIDRLEQRVSQDALELRTLEQREKRLILALGGLQRENELLREQLALGPGAALALAPSGAGASGVTHTDRSRPDRSRPDRTGAAPRRTRRRGWWARLFGART